MNKKMIQICRTFVLALALAMVAPAVDASAKNAVSVANTPPVVVATFPVAGDTNVDPAVNVIRVKLEAGKTYAIWINSPNYKHSAFRDTTNKPAVPYLRVFQTRK